SSSMLENDPEMKRKSAAVSFLRALGPDDSAMLTDYGNSGLHLRDLVCATSKRHVCSPAAPSFTRDKAQLIAAASQIFEGPDGTPLYESCVEMVSIVDTVRDQQRGMMLLSDGQPTSMAPRDACHRAATTAKIPVFTVGLGPAAETDPKADAAAVKVLRELASETGGSYASASDPAQLERLFANIGTALARGSCRTTVQVKATSPIAAGTTISGEISVGSTGATAAFSIVAPGP
ncbi:MAG TPA: vWA domain-containing protein, partial [Labilithrix sp.]|nr:vWA domain-containing protein [Labilithrix sp.]